MKKQLVPFISFWLLDSLLLYLAAWFLPFYFVLGNKNMSMVWAALASGLIWTFLEWISTPITRMVTKLKDGWIMFGFYFLANFVALWITARLSPVFGFGVISFVWLVFLAVAADVLQYLLWKLCGYKKVLK